MNAASVFAAIALFFQVALAAEPVELTDDSFAAAMESGPHFVKFYAPWCGHCQRLAPTWDELAGKYNVDEGKMTIAKVDCTQHTKTCSEQGVRGYPTLKYIHKSEEKKYQGQRTSESLSSFVDELTDHVANNNEEKVKASGPATIEGLTELDADNFDAFTSTGIHFVKFYAPWCGHCQRLAPTWSELAKKFESNDRVHVDKVDCTQHRDVCSRNSVGGYPTLILFRNGQNVERYQGSRDITSLATFIEKFDSTQEVNQEEEEEEVLEDEEATTEAPATEGAVLSLTSETFDSVIGEGLVFVKFYAPWCGHCKRLAPVYEQLSVVMTEEHVPVTIAEIDCTVHSDVCERNHVHGYPTLILYKKGQKLQEHAGSRVLEDLIAFVMDHVPAT